MTHVQRLCGESVRLHFDCNDSFQRVLKAAGDRTVGLSDLVDETGFSHVREAANEQCAGSWVDRRKPRHVLTNLHRGCN